MLPNRMSYPQDIAIFGGFVLEIAVRCCGDMDAGGY
jgi:hypothetical protein